MTKKQKISVLSSEVEEKIRQLNASIQSIKNSMPVIPVFPELLEVAEALKKLAPLQKALFSPLSDFTAKMGQFQQWFIDFKENGPYDQDVENIAKMGWYFNGMMLPREFVEVIGYVRENDIARLDDFFLNHIETNISEYREWCANWIKEAQEMVSEAFEQHIAGNYHSSIALFLILAEVVANRLLNEMGKNSHHGIFSSENKQPKTKKLFENDIVDLDPMFASYAPLMIFHAFNNKEKNVPSRDNILHGRYLSFGNKITSAKAISFIGYVILTLGDIKRKLTNDSVE